MNLSAPATRQPSCEIYPKRYFDKSPTWFVWNHLTAADVASLREEHGFERQHIYFHLNHPIRYVRLVGLLVDLFLPKNGNHIILRLDDSSGTCIEVKTQARVVAKDDTSVYPSNTVIDNLDVTHVMGVAKVFVDKKPVAMGTPIRVKGTIDTYRGNRQLDLKRIWIVRDTTEEVQCWEDTARWRQDVLCKPWVLTQAQRRERDDEIQREEALEKAREKRKRVANAEHEAKKLRHLERHEKRRREKEVKLNHGALPGSHVLPNRITDS